MSDDRILHELAHPVTPGSSRPIERDPAPAVSDNPYRFTVKVMPSTVFVGKTLAVLHVADADHDINLGAWPFPTEAEANLHADLILRALREAGRE